MHSPLDKTPALTNYVHCAYHAGQLAAAERKTFPCADSGVLARYVIVQLETLVAPLTLCEVEVEEAGELFKLKFEICVVFYS